MLSRRDILVGAGMAGAAALARPITTVFATAAQPTTPVNFDVPAGACDSHACVIGDPARFPFAADRGYTPETASLEELRSVYRALHIDRVVFVQPSFYGTDNSCILDAVKRIGRQARAVVIARDDISDAELEQHAPQRGLRNHQRGGRGPGGRGVGTAPFQNRGRKGEALQLAC